MLHNETYVRLQFDVKYKVLQKQYLSIFCKGLLAKK